MAENSYSSPPTAAPPEAPGTPDARTELPADAPAAGRAGAPPAMFRKLVLWAGGGAAALGVIVAVMLGVQFISSERSIHRIERAAVRPVVPAAVPAPLPAPVDPTVGVAAASAPAAQAAAQPVAGAEAATGVPATAGRLAAAPEPAAPEVAPAAPPTAEPAKASARKTSAAKRAKKRARSEGDTFKRCPPLGKPGAVMCRWHICNGGAGRRGRASRIWRGRRDRLCGSHAKPTY